MKFKVNMTIEVDEEENILPVTYNGKDGDEQALKDLLRDYLFDIDGITSKLCIASNISVLGSCPFTFSVM